MKEKNENLTQNAEAVIVKHSNGSYFIQITFEDNSFELIDDEQSYGSGSSLVGTWEIIPVSDCDDNEIVDRYNEIINGNHLYENEIVSGYTEVDELKWIGLKNENGMYIVFTIGDDGGLYQEDISEYNYSDIQNRIEKCFDSIEELEAEYTIVG